MTAQLRKDVDFNGLFRKLGHPLEEIRVRALDNIQSKLEHQLICYADIVHEKQLYIRLLEWFNIPECSHKTEVLGLLNRLAQHSAGAQLLQDMGAIEFLSQLRCDIEPCHRPIIDQILESIMLLPDPGTEQHAPECIYHRPTDSAIWGASTLTTVDASHGSHTSQSPGLRMATSMERLSQHGAQGYFGGVPSGVGHPTFVTTDYNAEAKDVLSSADVRESGMSFFRLSTFPWLPLTQTDQHVIVSTNSTLQTRDSATLIGACEFLADVVFQDFPSELFLQRPEILKNLLSIISLPDPADHPIVIQACKTLTCFIRCLQVRIRYFQDPAIYTSKQDFNSSTSTLVSSSNSAGSHIVGLPVQHHHHFDWRDQRHRGDGQDGDSSTSDSRSSSVNYDPGQNNMDADLELEDEPRLQHQQLTVPQLCVALLQRALPQLQTAHESLGAQVLELVHEVLVVLGPVLDTEVWSDGRDTAREVVDHLMNCLDSISELLAYHHHSQHALNPIDTTLGDLSTHRIIYMGLVNTLTRFLTIIPLEKMSSVLPDKLKLFLPTIVYDEALAMTNPRCRTICLAVAQSLGLSAPADFQQAMDICRSLTKTCSFCLQAESRDVSQDALAAMAEESMLSLSYHLHLPFVCKFIKFISTLCSLKDSNLNVITRCTGVLLQLMSYPMDSVRQVCYTTIVDIVKKSLQVSFATSPKSKESFQTKFLMNPDVLYELICFGLNDSVAKVRTCATDTIHHLLQSQLLMSDGLWQEFLLSLSKSLPVLQSYTDHSSPLGRSLWYMLDPTTTTHNLALLDKMRGSLRLMLLSDKKLRIDAAKHLKWFLSNEQATESKLPNACDLDPASMSACLILQTTQLVGDDCSRSVFKEEGVRQVYDIFSSDPVDPAVKKSAGDQLAIMMKDPYLHAVFKSRGGVEMVCSTIQKSVLKPGQDQKPQDDVSPYLPACLSILRSLTHHDYSLRHTLARDHTLYYNLLRVSLLYQADEQLKMDTSHIVTLLLFDEVAKFDVGFGQSQTPGTKFSLPAQVIQRYRLPFKPNCHHISSPSAVTLPAPCKDIMVTSGPREMMKTAWNCAWQGGLESLLESFQTGLVSATNNEFSDVLALTHVERVVLETSSVSWSMCSNIRAIQEASSHASVIAALDRMLSYTTALKMASMVQFFSSHEWYLVLEKFMMVTPSSASDQSLLLHILRFISSALQYLKPHPLSPGPALVWLVNKLHQPNGPLVNLVNTPTSGADSAIPSIKRSLNKELLHYLTSLNLTLPYQLSIRLKPVQMRGDLVRALQRGLNITDAPHFYNLATLEGNLACLMHITARPGWSRETSSLDAASLCNQLLNSLLEVVWSFHIGRGGTSRSYMGKGVTKSSTLCLRHLAYEMISNTEDQEWAKSWLYTRQELTDGTDHGLNWLLTLWAYRDSEVRAAGLGIAVALTSTEAGRLLVTANCKHIPGGLWGAAFSILLDPEECCMVRQQAALLLVNLTAQPMPSGDVETTPGTWQGPLVIDPDYQLMLIGTNALVALLHHTNFYASLADLLNSLYTSSLVQPVLATTVISKMMESLVEISVSSDTTGGERTGWTTTGLTSVSSWSTNPTGNPTPNLTPRSRVTLSTDHSKLSSQDNTLSTSTNTETSHGVDGGAYEPPGQPAPTQNLATPSLISSMVKLLVNVLNLTPHTCLDKIRAHSILTSLISTINPGAIHQLCDEMSKGRTGSASALTLIDLLRMYESVAELLTACVINDTNSRLEVLENKTGLKSLTSLVVLQWQEKDDVGNAFAGVSVSVLRLLSSLLQTHEAKVLSTLTVVLGPIWAPLVESICSMLDDHSANSLILHLSSLDFLALLCREESQHLKKNPDRMTDVATVSELFDATLGYDETPENAKEEKTTGKLVSKVLVGLFDTLTKSGPDDKGAQDMSRRLKVVSAFKSLLAVSQSAKEFALEAGLVELTIEHIKQTHAQLNLETLDMVTSGGRKEGPYLQELVNMFDFLRNFMYNNTSVKVACHHSGITLVIQKLWSWCQQEPTLLSSVLSFLITYSAHCNSAAGSLALPISAQTAGRPGGQGTLLHGILKLTQRELDRDECSPVLRLTFALLTNLVMNADCRNILWKNNFLNQFSQLNPRKKKGKMRITVDILWCELFSALSFSTDGQQIILKTPDVLTVLMDMMEAGPSRCQHCAMLIVRNLCCHAPNKPKILAADKLISVVMGQMENKTDNNRQLVASSALWALVYNSHKARIQCKAANIAPRLVDLLHDLQTSGSKSKVTASCCENLKAVICQLRD